MTWREFRDMAIPAVVALGLIWLVTCPGTAHPAPCKPTVAQMEALIVKYGEGHRRRRAAVARLLAPRIAIEAKRWRLDPIALLAVAAVESDFRPNVRGKLRPGSRRSAEVGVWQLIPNDSPVRRARRRLDRLCFGAKRLPACPVSVARAKRRRGRLTVRHLANLVIGTWVVAAEITQHLTACKRRHPGNHRINGPDWLARWGHYNSGPRNPTRWYLYKLGREYRRFRKALCRGRP